MRNRLFVTSWKLWPILRNHFAELRNRLITSNETLAQVFLIDILRNALFHQRSLRNVIILSFQNVNAHLSYFMTEHSQVTPGLPIK